MKSYPRDFKKQSRQVSDSPVVDKGDGQDYL